MLDDNQPFEDLVFGNIVITAGGYWLGYEDGINSFSFGISIIFLFQRGKK